MKRFKNNFFLWLLIFCAVYFLSDIFSDSVSNYKKVSFSDFIKSVKNKEIKTVELKGNNIYAEKNDGSMVSAYGAYIVSQEQFINQLLEYSNDIKILPPSNKGSFLTDFLVGWLPLILLFGFYFFRVSTRDGSTSPFSFSKSRARLLQVKGKVTFADVAGIDDAKEELVEIVDFLKDPDKYTDIGAKIPRGCLLIGSPGTGKTLLAKAIAGEANVPFYFISGSDFVEMFVGVGASRVRDMFTEAKKNAPCLVFIDEIDAVGRHRGVGIGGGNDEREQTLNQLLVEMDGFDGNEGVIVIAATNREDVLDKALLRPGRFDRQIRIQLPDVKGREEILKVHAKKVKMAPNVDLKSIAKSTPNFSGAELANIINEAGLLAARNNKKVITNEDIEEAKERVVMGIKNQSKIKKEEETRLIAYHEAGHALVTLNCENTDPIYKATIISRGGAGGYVARLPENDKHYTTMTKASIIDDITISMGGRAAEEVIFGENKITAGAISDIKSATYFAKNMVASWGMNDKIGPVYYADKLQSENGYTFEPASNETLELIDKEVKNIIQTAKDKAKKILLDNIDKLEIIANALIKYETLTGDEIKKLINGESIRDNDDSNENINNNLSSSLFASTFKGNLDSKNTNNLENNNFIDNSFKENNIINKDNKKNENV